MTTSTQPTTRLYDTRGIRPDDGYPKASLTLAQLQAMTPTEQDAMFPGAAAIIAEGIHKAQHSKTAEVSA